MITQHLSAHGLGGKGLPAAVLFIYLFYERDSNRAAGGA